MTKHIQRAQRAGAAISDDVKKTVKYYNNNFNDGWRAGGRLGKIRQYNSTRCLGTKIIGAVSNTRVKKEHLPAILGGIGFMTPIPGASLIGFGLGKLINRVAKFIK